MNNDETELLSEIRDLLKEQNALMADIKAMNVEAAGRNLLVMAGFAFYRFGSLSRMLGA